ncbi:Alpha-L-fucosidase [Arenibacter palladensis]|uniref:Alpha-L-fucosidase n=1 Tax=Arenibacter palladensis TaxID=237373 RepID=A0A1M4UBJ5_9FLAO|nr:alpha-L-fucosidase [Arenibacter palladensis]SHE53910.1 Alpha-L-fucosidase [Arenibacter palladensis]
MGNVVKDSLKSRWSMLLIFLLAIPLIAQDAPDPYAETGSSNTKTTIEPIVISNKEINVLSGGLAETGFNFKTTVLNYMFQWIESEAPGPYLMKWQLESSTEENYEVVARILGANINGTLSCNGKSIPFKSNEKDWSQIALGTISLKEGINTLELEINTAEKFKLSALELTAPSFAAKTDEEALKLRQKADWFKDAGYGLMFQWTNRATPEKGDTIKAWEDKVNDFDVEEFVDLVEDSGAAYVIWSITWGQQYISAPITSLDKVLKGRTTERDLLGEMADLLYAKGIKLIFYYHYGYDCYHSIDSKWMEASGGYKADKTEFYGNLKNIVAEVGNRYGKKLNGWFFDGAQRYYDTHFDGSSGGISTANFKEISKAAKTNNGQRIISYNSWILPKVTEYQDYYAGEGLKQFTGLDDGVFPEGNYKGLQAHSCFTLEKRWGHIDKNTTIASPKHSLDDLIGRIKHAQENRYPLSINLEMYEDGSVSPESRALLRKVSKAIRGK